MEENNKSKTLLYFTESYPYGISEQWKKNELEVFKKNFKNIVVIPSHYAGNREARNLVEGVEYRKPLFGDVEDRSLLAKLLVFLSYTSYFKLFREMFRSKAYLSLSKTKHLLKSCYQIGLLKNNDTYSKILSSQNRKDVVFYYYWGIGSVNIVPFINLDARKVCRFHGWDLYTERHADNYIPFQRDLLESLNLILPCSDFGKHYLVKKFQFIKDKVYTARLGTLSKGRSLASDDGILKVVTCSSVSPVKRLDVLCAALSKITVPTLWTHIGDGALFDEIKAMAESFPPNVKTRFVGFIPSENVLDFYIKNSFDLFVNVSENEGVPVSIMEAFSASLPVYATNVGGTSEITDDTVGKLLPANITPADLAVTLESFYNLPIDEKTQKRKNAFLRYEEKCNAYNNAEKLAKLLMQD